MSLNRYNTDISATSGMSNFLKVTLTAASETASSQKQSSAATWVKITGALVSLATIASLASYLFARRYKSSFRNTIAPTLGAACTEPEQEATWKEVFEILGELASTRTIPVGIVTKYSASTFASNSPNEDACMSYVYADATGSVRAIFGVFDGHSTRMASRYASEELPGFIERRMRMLEIQEKKLLASDAPTGEYQKYQTMRTSFVREALISSFMDADKCFLTESILMHMLHGGSASSGRSTLDRCFSGTCSTVVMIDRGILYCANAGDCRAVLGVATVNDDGNPVMVASPLSNDHNTDNARELRRIQSLHPNDIELFPNGRVKGILKPTRHIGGALLKEPVARKFIRNGSGISDTWNPPYTTAVPEVSYRLLTPADKFIILASDGLWDLISSTEAVHLVHEYGILLKKGRIPADINVCTFIIERALAKAHVPAQYLQANSPSNSTPNSDSSNNSNPSSSSNNNNSKVTSPNQTSSEKLENSNSSNNSSPLNPTTTTPASSISQPSIQLNSLLPSDGNSQTSSNDTPSPRPSAPAPLHSSHSTMRISSNAPTPNGTSLHPNTEGEATEELRRLVTIINLPENHRRDIYDDITVSVIWLDSGRQAKYSTLPPPTTSAWESPSFPPIIERLKKTKKSLPQAKPLNRLLASGTPDSILIREYLDMCWPDKQLDSWTSSGHSTRRFLKASGIEFPPTSSHHIRQGSASPTPDLEDNEIANQMDSATSSRLSFSGPPQ